ncbi:hypothetical protein [Solitalea canadensis]|uniref:Lipoprotein n=1 Tax=Solitalea canadensis (strain ATCC 29591 / DSM 3403 / JCM 21819 / LMG 8368 / NBRC 15130 / NCIMB 12057 / USAM 9D) TaxID=929556 RepID=H8KU57_SOLCM|nr:hypothetical protein [Solitalea canadensis]AFD07037.1 hypothetical protein Solca_1982 [Solitalea canadensis DSM 3403]
MKLITSKSLVLAAAIALTFTSCKKDDNEPSANAEQTSAVDNQLADDITTDEIDLFLTALQNKMPKTTTSASVSVETTDTGTDTRTGAVVTITGEGFPKTITVDFGTEGKTVNGITRKGKIIGTLTDYWWKPGAELKIVTENFSLNDVKITGTKIFTSKGYNETTNSYTYTVKVDRAKINSDNQTFTWSAERTITYYTKGTITALDDYFTVTGASSGTNRAGDSFTTTITTELNKPIISRWFVSGVIQHQVGSRPVAVLDYGNGTTDNKATVTIGGTTIEISLHR